MFGSIEFENFEGLTKMPQKAASAWSGSEVDKLIGVSYKPLIYVGSQPVKGTNHHFIVEQTLMTYPIVRRIATLTINEFDGKYEIVPDSIKTIFA